MKRRKKMKLLSKTYYIIYIGTELNIDSYIKKEKSIESTQILRYDYVRNSEKKKFI